MRLECFQRLQGLKKAVVNSLQIKIWHFDWNKSSLSNIDFWRDFDVLLIFLFFQYFWIWKYFQVAQLQEKYGKCRNSIHFVKIEWNGKVFWAESFFRPLVGFLRNGGGRRKKFFIFHFFKKILIFIFDFLFYFNFFKKFRSSWIIIFDFLPLFRSDWKILSFFRSVWIRIFREIEFSCCSKFSDFLFRIYMWLSIRILVHFCRKTVLKHFPKNFSRFFHQKFSEFFRKNFSEIFLQIFYFQTFSKFSAQKIKSSFWGGGYIFFEKVLTFVHVYCII